MSLELDPRDVYNLSSANVIIISESQFNMGVLFQTLSGLGFDNLEQCKRLETAKELMATRAFDLVIIEASQQSVDSYELVKWLRTETPPPSCFAPVIVTTAHIPQNSMSLALECGCDMVVKKPFTPTILLERIVWIGRPDRQFVFSDGYVGPQRPSAPTDVNADDMTQQIADDLFA